MFQLNYDELYKLSISHPEKIWDELAHEVDWYKPYTSVIENKESIISNWFVGGEINMSYNCLDKAIEEGYGDDVAVIHESPVTNTIEKITYKDLLKSVKLFAGMLVQKCDVKKGDMVLIYLPVIPQCMIAMLACCRIGAIYTVIYYGLSIHQLGLRMKHIESKIIITCNVGYNGNIEINFKEKIDLAISECGILPKFCIIYNRPHTKSSTLIEGRDLDWCKEMALCHPQHAIPLESKHPIFISYTSGTSGEPKGLIMATGNLVVLYKYFMKYLWFIKPKECSWMLSNFSWISGQILTAYGPLLIRGSSILYEGNPTNTPDPAQIVTIMNRNKVVTLTASPTVLRMLRKECTESDLCLKYDDLRSINIGGEVSDLEFKNWLSKTFKCPIYDIWGQTELNAAVTTPCLGLNKLDKSNVALSLGFQIKVVDSKSGKECPVGSIGELILKTPLPPSAAITIHKNHQRYLDLYFSKYPGYFDSKDCGRMLEDGTIEIVGRTDDIIIVGSSNICGGEIERICLQNKDLNNVAIVPLKNEIYGYVPFGFLIKKDDHNHSEQEIINEIIELVRKDLGELALFNKMVFVPDFPMTNTHTIARQSLANMINGYFSEVPSMVYNSEVYKTIYDILIKHGYKASLPTDN